MKKISILLIIGLNAYAQIPLPEHFGVDFHESMTNDKYSKEIAQRNKELVRTKYLYDSFIQHIDTRYQEEPRIPKIIHFIWVGPNEIPQKEQKYMQTWKDHHPDWTIKLWTDKEVAQLNLKNKIAYQRAKSWGEKSDILRYEILYRFGGLYVDTDYECFRPLDLFHHTCDFYVSMGFSEKFWLNNALIASRPGHPIMKECINAIPIAPENAKVWDAIYRTGPKFLTNCVRKYLFIENDLVLLPISYVSPLPWWKRAIADTEKQQWYKPETFAVHHWHVSWNKK